MIDSKGSDETTNDKYVYSYVVESSREYFNYAALKKIAKKK